MRAYRPLRLVQTLGFSLGVCRPAVVELRARAGRLITTGMKGGENASHPIHILAGCGLWPKKGLHTLARYGIRRDIS